MTTTGHRIIIVLQSIYVMFFHTGWRVVQYLRMAPTKIINDDAADESLASLVRLLAREDAQCHAAVAKTASQKAQRSNNAASKGAHGSQIFR